MSHYRDIIHINHADNWPANTVLLWLVWRRWSPCDERSLQWAITSSGQSAVSTGTHQPLWWYSGHLSIILLQTGNTGGSTLYIFCENIGLKLRKNSFILVKFPSTLWRSSTYIKAVTVICAAYDVIQTFINTSSMIITMIIIHICFVIFNSNLWLKR